MPNLNRTEINSPNYSDPFAGKFGIDVFDINFVQHRLSLSPRLNKAKALAQYEAAPSRYEKNIGLLQASAKAKLIDQGIQYTGIPEGLFHLENFDATDKQNAADHARKMADTIEFLHERRNENFVRYGTQLACMSDSEICLIARGIASRKNLDEPLTERQARRRVRSWKRQYVEQLAHNLGLTGKQKKYLRVSSFNLNEREEQNFRNEQSIGKMTVKTADGKEYSLEEIRKNAIDKNLAETYCLTEGIQEVAEEQGMKWAMLTMTASPSHHPIAKTFAGGSMLEAHREIHEKQRAIFKDFNRSEIFVAGLRNAEFHEDGCPHSHVSMYFHPSDEGRIKEIVSKQFTLTYDRDGHGFEGMPTCHWMPGDNKKSKFASYTFGYVLKSAIAKANGVETPEMKQLDALYSTWNLRRKSFFGLPSLTTWRELLKIDEKLIPPGFDKIKTLSHLVKNKDAAGFIREMGGLGIKNSKRPAKFSVLNKDTVFEIVGMEKEEDLGETYWKRFTVSREKCQLFSDSKPIKSQKHTPEKQTTKTKKATEEASKDGDAALIDSYSRETQTPTPKKQKIDFWEALDLSIFVLRQIQAPPN